MSSTKKIFKTLFLSFLIATNFSPEIIAASEYTIDYPVLGFVATDRLIKAIEEENIYNIKSELASQYAQGQSVIRTMLNERDPAISIAWVINNLYNQHGKTLVQQAQIDEDDLVEEMLTTKNWAHAKKLNQECMTPLHYAATKEEIDNLLKQGIDINSKDFKGNSPLHHAIIHDDYNIAKYLIDCGANINIQNNEGCTPFYLAVRYNRYSLMKLLHHKNADINMPNTNHNYPFTSAIYHGHTNAVRFISECKNFKHLSDDNKNCYLDDLLKLKNKNGIYSLFQYLNKNEQNTIVRTIIQNEQLDDLQFLFDSGAININHFNDSSSNNLLVYAPTLAVAKFLIKNEINCNQQNKRGNTPLHCITNIEILQHLLNTSGVHTHVKNKNGQTPLEQSIKNNNFDKTCLFHACDMHLKYNPIYLYLLAKNPKTKGLFKDAALERATIDIWWNNGTIDIDLDNEYKLEDFKPTQE